MLVSLRMSTPGPLLGPALGPVLGPVLGLLLLVAAAGCTSESPREPAATKAPEPTAESTPLADYDTSDLTLARAPFCDRVADTAISAALAGEPSDEQSWRPGGRLPDTKDISNEFGCAWTAGAVTARAWVFAPPMSAERATDAVAASEPGKNCRPLPSAPSLGTPGVARSCELDSGDSLVGFAGLVGDAWVSCEITGPGVTRGDGVTRGGDWCVAILEALRSA